MRARKVLKAYNRYGTQPEIEPHWYIQTYPTKPFQRNTFLRGHDKKHQADKVAARHQAEIDAAVAAGRAPDGVVTVAQFVKDWIAQLRLDKPDHSSLEIYEGVMRNHVLPHIGSMPVEDVSGPDLDGILRALGRSLPAPRTRRKVWRLIVQVFLAAVNKRHIVENPCRHITPALRPPNKDADPEWRDQAVFTQAEAEALIFDERVRPDRRVYYALLYLLGIRQGEASALRVRLWGRRRAGDEALGRMTVAWSYNSQKRLIKETKTGVTRIVPIHPLLEEILTDWLSPGGGWAQMFGRDPGPDDFIVPSTRTPHQPRHRAGVLPAWHADVARLGLRKRRMHDTRSTYIALLLDHEASETMIRFTTHGGRKEGSHDAFEVYKRRPGWLLLCAQILKLPLARPRPDAQVLTLSNVAGLGASFIRDTYETQKPEQSQADKSSTGTPPCTALRGGQQGTGKAPKGNVGDSNGGRRALSSPAEEKSRHVCASVSAVSGALRALEKGDSARAIAILRKAAGR